MVSYVILRPFFAPNSRNVHTSRNNYLEMAMKKTKYDKTNEDIIHSHIILYVMCSTYKTQS